MIRRAAFTLMARLCAAICCLLVVLTAFPIGAKTAPEDVALHVLPDPGPRPTFKPSEYDGYGRAGGTAKLIGNISLALPGATNETCIAEDVYLYPDTAYTQWMLTTWARLLDGHAENVGILYPGDRATNIPAPSYLNPANYHGASALQLGNCTPHGSYSTVSFDRVPAGKYILVVKLHHDELYTHSRFHSVMVDTPDGPYPVDVEDPPLITRRATGDGYVMVSLHELNVAAGHSYTLNPQDIVPVAHFLPSTHF